MNLTCGFELEVSGHAGNVLAGLRSRGLTDYEGLHDYHCHCDDCDSPEYIFKAQEDCTAAGEFITRVLEYGTAELETACSGIGSALVECGARVGGSVGNHVHISRDELRADHAASRRLARLFARYEHDLYEIAAGPRSEIRRYNGDGAEWSPSLWHDIDEGNDGANYHRGGNTIAWKQYTVEFRLWNATRAGWRIRTHVGLSHAMVTAALGGADCERHDPRCLEEVIGDYIDGPTWAGVLRQRYSKGGFAAEVSA